MDTNRPSSTKWVSRRTLDSQAHNRDHSAGAQPARGNAPHVNVDNAHANSNTSNGDRRKYGNADLALPNTGNTRIAGNSGNGGGSGGGGYRANSGHRFGAAGAGAITPSPGASMNKINHHGMGYTAASVNSHAPHSQGNNGNGGRRSYGGNGYGEQPETTMAPPPRSVQMGQGMLPAHSAARDLIPQPRRAKALHAAAAAAAASPKPSEGTADTAAARRWAATTTAPTPRSAQNGSAAPAAGHHDANAGLAVPRPSSLAAQSSPADVAPLAVANGAVRTPLPPAAPTRAPAAAPAVRSPLESYQLSAHLIFDPHDLDEPMGMQPMEIEELLGQVERSASAAAGPRDSALGGSLKERRTVADWGIEEAIKSVLPGMDEDDPIDDGQGPNAFASSLAAISGSWHTTAEGDARQPAGVGLLADFPTSFAASFSEPVSAVLGSPFSGEPAAAAMDNLSRAFSTAARVDSSSFATSPGTTSAATPLQRPPNSPGMHLPHYASPEEMTAMPLSTRDVSATAALGGDAAGPPSAAEGYNDLLAKLIANFPAKAAAPTPTSPWLSSGTADTPKALQLPERADQAAPPTPPGTAERPPERCHAPAALSRPAVLQAIAVKNASLDSAGLTASLNTTSPAMLGTHQSSVTTCSHGLASAPDTPSLKKESSTPLSASRSQPYGSGNGRPQRPSLSAPAVNRQTMTHIFRETPQSQLRKERMDYNHQHSGTALCCDAEWPPRNEADVDHLLRSRGATKLLRHLTIISFSRQHISGVQDLFDTWAKNGIPAPDMGFGAYYYYVKEKSEKLLCMKHNGRGPSPGHGYGRCDFESRRPYSTCRYEHVCLFCRSKEHGWFEEGKCQGYQQLLSEMEDLGVNEEDVTTLLNAMERPAKTSWQR